MSNRVYNGWTNYETWRINLEIFDGLDEEFWRGQYVESLRDYVDEALTNFGETETGLALDYARAFVQDVNFHEILKMHQEEFDLDVAV